MTGTDTLIYDPALDYYERELERWTKERDTAEAMVQWLSQQIHEIQKEKASSLKQY